MNSTQRHKETKAQRWIRKAIKTIAIYHEQGNCVSALAILFSFMILSAQFYFSGFYTHIIERMEKWSLTPSQLLLVTILLSGFLSAMLINDIVCLALTPLIIKVCFKKQLNPIPFLMGLVCSSNIGSAITLVGNPQNLLIGQVLNISFVDYMKLSFVPCVFSLFAVWLIITFQVKGEWVQESLEMHPKSSENIPFDFWQSTKGVVVLLLLLSIFLLTDIPRDHVSLAAAGCLLLSRKMASQTMLSFIDWQLLVLFIGLFIVNRSFVGMHDLNSFSRILESYHIDMSSPVWIVMISLILSNIVSNVPAVMLLLPLIQTDSAGALLAISSTFAGNLFIVGSIANLIVISQASQFGVNIHWRKYVKTGLPVTAVSFAILFMWMSHFA